MRVECAQCGHHADAIYEFHLPRTKAQPMEAFEPGERPDYGLM